MSRTVIFDIGGVYFSDGTRIAIDSIAAKYDISRDVVADFINGEPGREYRIGRISGDQFWQRAIRKWNIRSSLDAFRFSEAIAELKIHLSDNNSAEA